MAGLNSSFSHGLIANSLIFQDCVSAFKSHVPPHIVQGFQHIVSLKDLNIAIQDVERQQAASRSLRNLRRIEPFLKILNEYSPVIETLTNAKPDVLALIWGPIKFCLQIACKYSKAFDSLLSAYRKIQEALPSISNIEKLFGSHDIVLMVLKRVYTDILKFHQRAILFFAKPGWKLILQTTCRTFDDSFGDVLENLQNSKQLLHTNADIASYVDAQEARIRVEQAFLDQQNRERQLRKLTIQSWLNAVPHKNQHLELQSLRKKFPDTCGWLFKDRSWTSWMAGTLNGRQLFWISGIPGAGKTVLFSSMVDEIRRHTNTTARHSITVYLYCKYNDNARDNFVVLARSLINSLLEGNELCYDYLYDVAVNSNEQCATSTDLLSNTIVSLLQFYDHIYIGIDGLDEVEPTERAMMVKLMLQIQSLTDDDHLVHIFLTSRAEIDMEKSFSSVDRFKLEANHMIGDIRRYAVVRSQDLVSLQVDQSLLDSLVETTVDRSAGMFLLAKLIFDMFDLCVNREDFEDELRNRELPVGIEEAYHRILLRIQKRDQVARHPRAARLLEILAFARRTLYLHEVQAALSIDIRRGDIDFRNRRYTQHFKEICGSIVEVNSDETVVLVHATAKQYLSQHDHSIFNVFDAQGRFADTCITYLSMDFFDFDSDKIAFNSAAQDGRFGFYRYAFCNWLSHVSQAIEAREMTPKDFWSSRNLSKISKNGIPIGLGCHNMHVEINELDRVPSTIFEQLSSLRAALEDIETGNTPADAGSALLDKALDRIKQVQCVIERTISEATTYDVTAFLKAAYGSNPYLCDRLGCPRFHQGFNSSMERDNHAKTHLRPYKCNFSECDFGRTGFGTRAALENHVRLFHVDNLSFQFSQLDTRPLTTRIKEAIRHNDTQTLESLCPRITHDTFQDIEMRKMILQAMKTEAVEAASTLIKHCNSLKSLFAWMRRTRVSSPDKLLAEAVSRGQGEVLQVLLDRYESTSLSAAIRGQMQSSYLPRLLFQCIKRKSLDCLKVMLEHEALRDTVRIHSRKMSGLLDIPEILPLLAGWRTSSKRPVIEVADFSNLLCQHIKERSFDSVRALLDHKDFGNALGSYLPATLKSPGFSSILPHLLDENIIGPEEFSYLIRQCVEHGCLNDLKELSNHKSFRDALRKDTDTMLALLDSPEILASLVDMALFSEESIIQVRDFPQFLRQYIELRPLHSLKALLNHRISRDMLELHFPDMPESPDLSDILPFLLDGTVFLEGPIIGRQGSSHLLHQCFEHKSLDDLKLFFSQKAFRDEFREDDNMMLLSLTFTEALPLLVNMTVFPEGAIIDGEEAMWMAIEYSDVKAVQALLQAGVSVVCTDEQRCNPICHSICSSGRSDNSKVMQILIDNGASVDHCIRHSLVDGTTLLHQAVRLWKIPSLECLLRNGADHTIENREGNTAFNTLVYRDSGNMPPLAVCLQSITGNELIPAVKRFLSLGADCHTTTGEELLPVVHVIALNESKNLVMLAEALKLMIENGSDIDQTNSAGRSAREFLTIKRPELLEHAGLTLWYPRADEVSNIRVEQQDSQLAKNAIMDVQMKRPLSSELEKINAHGSFMNIDPELEAIFDLRLASEQGSITEQNPATSSSNSQSYLPILLADGNAYSYDRSMEELHNNPWAQEDTKTPWGEGDEPSQPYQYSAMQR